MEIPLETLKSRNVVGLPIVWGIGGMWKYTEGSRNKIRSEGLTRMRAGRLKGMELGVVVLVWGRGALGLMQLSSSVCQ